MIFDTEDAQEVLGVDESTLRHILGLRTWVDIGSAYNPVKAEIDTRSMFLHWYQVERILAVQKTIEIAVQALGHFQHTTEWFQTPKTLWVHDDIPIELMSKPGKEGLDHIERIGVKLLEIANLKDIALVKGLGGS